MTEVEKLFIEECNANCVNFDSGHANYVDDTFGRVLEAVEGLVKKLHLHSVINNEAVICKDCGKYKKTQGNGIMHQLCECASEVTVCADCVFYSDCRNMPDYDGYTCSLWRAN